MIGVISCDPGRGGGIRTRTSCSQTRIDRVSTHRWPGGSRPTSSLGSSVDVAFYLLLRWIHALDFTRQDGAAAQVYLMLIATTPLTGRMLLWVLAPSAVLDQEAKA
jgi:hypothetical protein